MPADEIRRIADEVLARPEFAQAQPSLWQRFLRWLVTMLARLRDAIGGGGRGSVIGLAVFVLLAVAVVAVVIRYTKTLRRDPRRDVVVPGSVGRSSRDWLAEAAEHERQQRWRDAIRCRYRAVLADLAAEGLVEEIAGRTSGEYLAAVTQDVPRAAPAFAEVTRRFEHAWYSHAPVSADDLQGFAAAARSTLAEARGRRASLTTAS